MTPRWRIGVFLVAAAVFGVVLVAGFAGLPDFGHYSGVYGEVLNHIAVPQRHGTDIVTAINFDYRAFDTLGEEFILFGSVIGVAILLRQRRGEHDRAPSEGGDEHHFPGTSNALRATALLLVAPALALGVYIVSHGQLTPGGGFQGGVVLGAALLLVFLGGEYVAMKIIAPHLMVEAAEALGAAAYALIGIGGLIFATAFFENFLALGIPGRILSAGTIPINSIAVGVEVTGAFVLLWTEFLDQALVIRGD
jgi:multicomponent Na+:H+ antiporter subunit B